ncbi:MAG TPA: potassium-transporting ATPase subunit KdpC [Bacteroidales bacterium]|nr:potassium-transporting ATPase subunit KdpC [Bacteroidales bacterium]
MKRLAITAFRFLMVMTLLTGVVYVVLITAAGQLLFPAKSNGSLVMKNGRVAGSELIGQNFDSAAYFWSRPSSVFYNAVPSGGSNLGPTSDSLRKVVACRRTNFSVMNMVPDTVGVPREMIFSSASGLDPHISPSAALLQVNRIARARNLNDKQREQVLSLIKNLTEDRQFHLLGERRINVFLLNLSLDKIQ